MPTGFYVCFPRVVCFNVILIHFAQVLGRALFQLLLDRFAGHSLAFGEAVFVILLYFAAGRVHQSRQDLVDARNYLIKKVEGSRSSNFVSW